MTPFITAEEERHDNYQRNAYENIQHNQRRRMQLQSEFQSQQRNHRLSRAAWLQGRWLEISEQEQRAQIHNQKLLQDFQRAQDTLNDMLARTEAMNNIRVHYEQYLEENFPQWQKRLKDIRVSEKSKWVQQHLKSTALKENEGMKTAHRSDFRGHPLSSNSSNPSQTSHTMQHTQTAKDIRQNTERCNPNGHHPYFPPTWLTGSQSFISGLPQNNIPKDYKNLQNSQALNHPLPAYYSLPGDSFHQSHSPVQQKSPSMDHLWAGIRQGFMPSAHFTPAGASWPQLPVLNPMMWGTMDVPNPSEEKIQHSETDKEKVKKETLNPNEESCQRLKHKRNGKESDRSELDCRPVRLSIDHEESSEGSAVPSEVTVSGMQKRGKKKRNGTKSHSTENDNNSQVSSTSMLEDAPESHLDTKISKIHQKTSKKYSRKESIITKKNVDAVMQDEEEQEESRSQEILPSSVRSEKKDGSEGLNIPDEEDFEGNGDSDVAEEKIRDREVEAEEKDEEGTGGEEEAGSGDETHGDDEEGCEKMAGKRDGFEPSGEGDDPEDIPESEDGEETTEEEGRENSFQDEKEAIKTQGLVEDDKKVNTSDRHIHKSLEKLYADETEEEEVYNQEIEEDEDDEVVVEKAYPWSRDPIDDRTKCPDDEDDDIEGLLNPVNSQTQKEDEVEETDQSNDQQSASEEENLPQENCPPAINESVESDDEFDHFYD